MLDDDIRTTTSATILADGDGDSPRRTGVWFIGGRGSVATTATLGLHAVSRGLAPETGLVSQLEEVAQAGLVGFDSLVVGGHDVGTHSLADRAAELAEGGVFHPALVAALREELDAADRRIRPGVPAGGHQREASDRIQQDLTAFRDEHGLDRVVVVDVSSTEPPAPDHPALHDLDRLEQELDAGRAPLPPSSLYSYAAFRAGCPVVAFTPSTGPNIPALADLAKEAEVPWAGRDGKTGETLVKATLAPLFARRALHVRSWAAMNLLGGGDGRTLAEPAAAVSKTTTKALTVQSIVGYPVEGPVRIDYVEDLGDWKTAWDHITFDGFLGTRMTMQFTWQGCDSALAAPLVLDLARLVARAHEVGESGPLAPLGFFFKEPIGASTHALDEQWATLTRWCARLAPTP
ncbi:myo-inositol-1-phosphate synthase [Georgenia soli]|uniref:Myo-inositol-1-phosphate synthase n=1 Tax=Georgenia soli TaxID=638953 RepID=A0A2A9EJQ6_9MICO|nr:inositol-3-phosphate synthase [Georgenia soli]PFG39138.1 myo-inositol-1-phosphate synthase [Georgenia soli]